MKDIAQIRTAETFKEKDFSEFIRKLAKQAKKLDEEGLFTEPKDKDRERIDTGRTV